jgi:hypothetical protein
MAASRQRRKRSRLLYQQVRLSLQLTRSRTMLGLALVCFIGLFAFGGNFLGWTDPAGKVQLGLFMSFLFGIVCGYRTRD